MPVSLHALAWIAFWPLAAASCFAALAPVWPGRPVGRRMPWGLFAAVEWLYALDLVVLVSGWPAFWRGVGWLWAALHVWEGFRFYRRWEDDDENRPRRRRRVLRRAVSGA
ncbi:hypothetical protein OG216_09840 [Streptomycetaceae bacterium NBC_01309]